MISSNEKHSKPRSGTYNFRTIIVELINRIIRNSKGVFENFDLFLLPFDYQEHGDHAKAHARNGEPCHAANVGNFEWICSV